MKIERGCSMCKILIVEDEKKISRIIELQLKHEGYETDTAYDGIEAIQKVKEDNSYDLILLDIMMPRLNGIETCKEIKMFNKDVAIIMLTAKDTIADVINGLDSGADDYVTKPFIFDELLARIRANLRKNTSNKQSDNKDVLTFQDLDINNITFEVTRANNKVELSKTEFDLLYYMVLNQNIVLSRDQILNKVWGYDYCGSENIVDVYIKYLRDKIDKDYDTKLIHTVRGRGYVVK